jgi:hypothetical protein
LVQYSLQVGRKRRGELAFFTAARQAQAETRSVEKEPWRRQALAAQTIDRIAHDGMAAPGEMDADLMRAPGDRMGAYKAEVA